MNTHYYTTGEFAKKTSVSVRTLRYYDKKEILSPTTHNKSGHRLYSDNDIIKLQNILALKFLGFSLDEIKAFIKNPAQLQETLAWQRIMMTEKRNQLDKILQAIDKTEQLIKNDQFDLNSIVKVIEVIQMELKPEWMNKYLSTEERIYMRELAKKSYSREALKKLGERGWTEENQKNFSERYKIFRDELKRLVDNNADPESNEAQELAKLLREINTNYSKGDPEIIKGMKKSWENYNSIPDERKPPIYKLSEEEREFIKKAMAFLYKNSGNSKPSE